MVLDLLKRDDYPPGDENDLSPEEMDQILTDIEDDSTAQDAAIQAAIDAITLANQAIATANTAIADLGSNKLDASAVGEDDGIAPLSSGVLPGIRLPDSLVKTLDAADNEIINALLIRFYEKKVTATITSGVLTLDLTQGTHFIVTVDEDITGIDYVGAPPAGHSLGIVVDFIQGTTGGVVTWPATFESHEATLPILSGGQGLKDKIGITVDGDGDDFVCLAGKGVA